MEFEETTHNISSLQAAKYSLCTQMPRNKKIKTKLGPNS